MISRLLETGLGPSEITYSQILPTAVAMVPSQAQVFTQIIDYYLSDAGKKHLVAINRIAKEDSPNPMKSYCGTAWKLFVFMKHSDRIVNQRPTSLWKIEVGV